MTVIVSYHGMPESDRAVSAALSLAERTEQRLVAVMARKTSPNDTRTIDTVADRLWDALENSNVPHEVRQARADIDIAESVIEVAEEVKATTIVIGLRRDSYKALTIGRNAVHILLRAPCPVLAVKEGDVI